MKGKGFRMLMVLVLPALSVMVMGANCDDAGYRSHGSWDKGKAAAKRQYEQQKQNAKDFKRGWDRHP